jgi:hypothetical protein
MIVARVEGTGGLRRRPLSSSITAALLATALSSVAASAAAATQTLVLQQGRDGWTGCRDTWVSGADWDTPPQHTVNYGQNQILRLSRNGGDNPLLRFDLAAIPANSAVLAATLELYNTTASSYSGSAEIPRRIEAFRVLQGWDEGNQADSPIAASGSHGATGDHAFDYYPGEGVDIPWHARALAATSDYAAAKESHADVVNPGWYAWDLTMAVTGWVRGELPNHGVVLRDASGYADGHTDWRDFHSAQGNDAALRPRLVVVYDPDTPLADAGGDIVDLSWDGSPVTLDASASRDRPGGNDATLAYRWRIVRPAFGSALAGELPGTGKLLAFAADAAGEWEIAVTVSNDAGASATDMIAVRLLRLAAAHPRIFLTPQKLAALRSRAVPGNPRWAALLDEADAADGEMHAKALAAQVTGDVSLCDQAIVRALAIAADPSDWSTRVGDIAVVYDWCHHRLAPAQRSQLVAFFDAWGDDGEKGNDSPGWGNYWPRWGYSYALAGLASWGESARATEWLDEFRHRRFAGVDLPLLDHIAAGGAWPEGMIYDWIANWPRVKALEAWRTATGEDLFASTSWFRERLPYILLHRFPGIAEQWGVAFHPYLSFGDTERNRGSIANYERIMALILLERFPSAGVAAQLRGYLAAPPADGSLGFLAHEEFLWFDPDATRAAPSERAHIARGTGTVFARSGWPAGAADTDPAATYLTFQCGDHFSYHQHYDQNSFTLSKRGDLLLDSGVYSGDGLSDHDVNYYVRTAAHNSLVVQNPGEDFSSARPDATANDGGQRTPAPATRSPQSLEYFLQHSTHYETGDIVSYCDDPRFLFVAGDATAAYNSPGYNQASDTSLAGNVAKVSRFVRELVYLRPTTAAGPTGRDYLVLLDRVGVTEPRFSGASTRLLFHTLGEPEVDAPGSAVSPGETLHANAAAAAAAAGDGRVFLRFLLPAARNVRVIGGRGVKAFWVDGANHDWHWDPGESQPRPTNDFEDVPYGEWRLALEPADDALEHVFLTVVHPAAAAAVAMPAATLVDGGSVVGVHIADPELPRVVLFSSAADGSAPAGDIAYTIPAGSPALHLIGDLEPGARYRLAVSLTPAGLSVALSPSPTGSLRASDQGILAFDPSNLSRPLRRRL